MSLFNSFDRTRHLDELLEPLETQGMGVLTPAQRQALALKNLTGGTAMTAAQLAALAGVVPGTVAASKAVVVDASKNASAFAALGAVDVDAGSSGVVGTVDVFPTTASKGRLRLAATDSAGDTITTLTNTSQAAARAYSLPDAGADGKVVLAGGNAAVALTGTGGTSTGTMTTLSAQVTSASITTAGGATHVATITYTGLSASDIVLITKAGGTNSATENYSYKAVVTSNTITVTLSNNTAATALNGTVIFNILVVKA